ISRGQTVRVVLLPAGRGRKGARKTLRTAVGLDLPNLWDGAAWMPVLLLPRFRFPARLWQPKRSWPAHRDEPGGMPVPAIYASAVMVQMAGTEAGHDGMLVGVSVILQVGVSPNPGAAGARGVRGRRPGFPCCGGGCHPG